MPGMGLAQTAMIGGAAEFSLQLCLAQQRVAAITKSLIFFSPRPQMLHLMCFGSAMQITPLQITCDVVFNDARRDQCFGFFSQIKRALCICLAQLCFNFRLAGGKPGANLPAIAARGTVSNCFGLEDDHLIARLGKLQRRGKSGVASADDDDISRHVPSQRFALDHLVGRGLVIRLRIADFAHRL